MRPDDTYEAYRHALRALKRAATDRDASIASVAVAFERLLARYPPAARPVLSLALGDALGGLPARSRVHLLRTLAGSRDDPVGSTH